MKKKVQSGLTSAPLLEKGGGDEDGDSNDISIRVKRISRKAPQGWANSYSSLQRTRS